MRRWLPHDPGRSCLFHTITHYVTNQTNSQNAGACVWNTFSRSTGTYAPYQRESTHERLPPSRLDNNRSFVPGTVMVDAAYRQSEDRMEQHMDLTTAELPSVVP
jgi:hypothetical protein